MLNILSLTWLAHIAILGFSIFMLDNICHFAATEISLVDAITNA